MVFTVGVARSPTHDGPVSLRFWTSRSSSRCPFRKPHSPLHMGGTSAMPLFLSRRVRKTPKRIFRLHRGTLSSVLIRYHRLGPSAKRTARSAAYPSYRPPARVVSAAAASVAAATGLCLPSGSGSPLPRSRNVAALCRRRTRRLEPPPRPELVPPSSEDKRAGPPRRRACHKALLFDRCAEPQWRSPDMKMNITSHKKL